MKKCLLETNVIDWNKPVFNFIKENLQYIFDEVLEEKKKIYKFSSTLTKLTYFYKSIEECAQTEIES